MWETLPAANRPALHPDRWDIYAECDPRQPESPPVRCGVHAFYWLYRCVHPEAPAITAADIAPLAVALVAEIFRLGRALDPACPSAQAEPYGYALAFSDDNLLRRNAA